MQVSRAEVPESEGDLVGAVTLSEPAASDSSVSQQTVHVIIDKIDEGDLTAKELTSAVLQVDGSVAFPSSATTVIVQKSDGGDLGQIMEETQPVHEPDTSEDQLDASQQLGTGDINDSHNSPVGSRDTSSPKNNKDSVPSPTERVMDESALQDDPDPDFLFVLVRTNIKGASLNYIRQGFKCFHCDFKTSWRRVLMKHMRDKHADSLAIHQCIVVHKSEKLHGQQVSVLNTSFNDLHYS